MKYYILHYYYVAPKGDSGETLGQVLDLSNACPTCGTGTKLVGGLLVTGLNNVKKDFFATEAQDYLISKKLYDIFQNANILFETSQVVNKKGEFLDFYHLKSNYTFPKMLPQSKGFKIGLLNQCKNCKRDNYLGDLVWDSKKKANMIVPFQLSFEVEDKRFLDQSDIFQTWEYWGKSTMKFLRGNPMFGRPSLIVNERIKQIFEEQKIKNAFFDEVIIL